jgi:hydrogenase maturation protein HypF
MMLAHRALTRRRLKVAGVVQGVGFRPHAFRLASELDLVGFVTNDSSGVIIEIEGPPGVLDRFQTRLVEEAPPLALIEAVVCTDMSCTDETGFRIDESTSSSGERTLVPPDVAACEACLLEVSDPSDRRYRYPFTNCTNCGPRFTIITDLPYDRPSTTMSTFAMCPECSAEYTDPVDRRYHAQPIACPTCGPRLTFEEGGRVRVGTDPAIAAFHLRLAAGGIVAVKGIGGYHLACDARSDEAIGELRARKGRVDKPFALMVANLSVAEELAFLDSDEMTTLMSPARPIVLLSARPGRFISHLVAPGSPMVGIMAPYSPLHHLLFAPVPGSDSQPPQALVLTSANLVDEPICYLDDEARVRLAGLADAFLTHDRPIRVPCDDSVVRMVDGQTQPVRRGRGYAPLPVNLPVAVAPTLAVGGELKNTFCLAVGRHAWVSQHVGDMANLETLDAFSRGVEDSCRMHQVEPTRWAADAHPGYLSSRWAASRATGPVVKVQHHHAHVAALMAESGLDGSSPVIGVTFDGTGFATTSSGATEVWGGEVLVADYEGYERAGHLRALPLPGGDAGVANPCRVAIAYLRSMGIDLDARLEPVRACQSIELGLVTRQVDTGTGVMATSSMGRLFDAVASLLGVRHRVSYEAQAAMELEALADTSRADPFAANWAFGIGDDLIMDPEPLLRRMIADLLSGADRADLALAFHRSVAYAIVAVTTRLRRNLGALPVLLTGGVFQNALLTRLTRISLEEAGVEVYTHRLVPPNDGGLSLGQAIIAGRRRA